MRTAYVTNEHSRALLLAQRATGRPSALLEQALKASRVAVSLDPAMPGAYLTAEVLLTTLRRGPGQLVLERGGLSSAAAGQLEAAVAAVDPARPLQIVTQGGSTATVRLHAGAGDTRAIRIVPEGYGAHIAGQSTAVIRPVRPGNAVGAVYTAALGAAEAFKWTANVLPGRRVLHRHLRFCPVMLTSDLGAAPDLPTTLDLDLALLGVGAVGTGIVLLLNALNATGRILPVDKERFGLENCGTYSIGGAAEAQTAPWKTDLVRAALHRFDIISFRGLVEQLPEAIDSGDIPWPRTVLTALDSAEARRAAQRLWPDQLIDAGTGDTMLGIHDHQHGAGPCMICFFPPERSGTSAARRLADLTGLTPERAMRGDDPLTGKDLTDLTEAQQQRLRSHLGKPVCGLAQAIGLTGLDAAGFRPSIPFISLQAACLSIGRLLTTRVGVTPTANLVQYDGLFGPQAVTTNRMDQRAECYCRTHAKVIEQVRQMRARSSTSSDKDADR
jgi:hypothetical protein